MINIFKYDIYKYKGEKVVCVCARVRACVRVRACKGDGTIIFDSNCSDNKEYRMTMQALQRQNVLGYHAPDILKLCDLTGRLLLSLSINFVKEDELCQVQRCH